MHVILSFLFLFFPFPSSFFLLFKKKSFCVGCMISRNLRTIKQYIVQVLSSARISEIVKNRKLFRVLTNDKNRKRK